MSKAPLILVENGYRSWMILKPDCCFNEPIQTTGFGGLKDRRYVEQTVVNGTLKDALEVLHQLERGGGSEVTTAELTEAFSDIRKLIELCRSGEFYQDYDLSTATLAMADEALGILEETLGRDSR